MKDTGMLNELWSRLLVEELIHHGVRTFCIAPGSRSSPLTIAAATHPLAETIVHYDERGLSFYALGYAKGSERPVAIIVTSGSAVGNLLPAVMEAYHDQVPLVLLTADRPPELKDTGANQATDQTKIFQNFVHWQCDFPCPDQKIPQAFIGTTVAQALSHALSKPSGPIHLNCMFRKPLHEISEPTSFSQQSPNRLMHRAETTLAIGKPQVDEKTYEQIGDELSQYEKGIILLSGSENLQNNEKIYALSRALQWPIFPDVLSQIRNQGPKSGIISYYPLIIKAVGFNEDYAPDAILQLGDRFISDQLLDWIAIKKPTIHCHIASHTKRKDPIHSITHRVITDLNTFTHNLPNYLSGNLPSRWLEAWKELNTLCQKGVASYFKAHADLSEPYLFHTLASYGDPSTRFFFSNSMPIRNGDSFFSPKKPLGQVYGNRGLSGIDGNIATIAGIAKGSGKPLVAVIGDLAFLHDINSLPLIQDLAVKLIVINNHGGDIYSFLPISERNDVFKTYFKTPHSFSFESAGRLFGIDYESPQIVEDLSRALSGPRSMIIEVTTQPNGSKQIHQTITTNLRESLGRVFS